MKLQKAKRLCVASEQINLITGPDGEWLSDGRAAWESEKMDITVRNVRALMDVTEKQIAPDFIREVDYTHRDAYSAYHDARIDEVLEYRGEVMVDWERYIVLVPKEGEMRPRYIRRAELDPILDGKHMPAYWLRRAQSEGEQELVAVGYDLCVVALILPERRQTREEAERAGIATGADRIEERIRELYGML